MTTAATISEDPENNGQPLELADLHKQLQHLNKQLATQKADSSSTVDEIDLREYWNAIMRRKGVVFAALAVALIAALLITFLMTPIYRATLVLQIERETSKVLEYESLTPEEAVNTKDFYETQYEMLKSRNLARRVIDQLGLDTSDTFTEREGNSLITGFAPAVERLFGRGDTASEDAAEEETDIEELFLENLSIEPIKNSRLVRIHYHSPNPEEAAIVANTIGQSFINMTLERRYEASSYAKTFLEEQIKQVRANLEDSERRLVAYARERGIINIDDRLQILMQNLAENSTELTQAESLRMQAESDYQQMLAHGKHNTPEVLKSPVIQALKERKSELQAERQELLRTFTREYPTVQENQQQIQEMEQQIEQESSAIANSLKAQFFSYVDKEVKLKKKIAEIKDEILALQDRSTDFQSLKREVDTNRELYDGLLQRMKEVGVAAGVTNNNISVLDAAKVSREKYKPSLAINLAVALALGLFSGILLVFLFEVLDDTLKNSEDVEKRTDLPVLGVIPAINEQQLANADGDIGLLSFKDPKSALAEAYRTVRTTLFFSTSEGAPKILHFTSSSPGEGKTTSAISMAVTFSHAKSKVLLIDCDLRNPSLHQVFGLANTNGLTNYLAGKAKPIEIAQPTCVPDLFVVTSGPLPPNPVELLSTAKMIDFVNLGKERFDYVIIDGPPVIGLADTVVLSSLATATVFIVEAGGTRIGALEGSLKRLRSNNAKLIGCILTKQGQAGSGYGYGYGYNYDYHYSYSYGGGGDTNPALSNRNVS